MIDLANWQVISSLFKFDTAVNSNNTFIYAAGLRIFILIQQMWASYENFRAVPADDIIYGPGYATLGELSEVNRLELSFLKTENFNENPKSACEPRDR
jgi:hypothetical protein